MATITPGYRTFSIAPAVLLLATAGCASGIPDVVKYAPDARAIVYQDAMYHRVYIYETQSGRRHVFEGVLACVDRSVKRLVLLQMPEGVRLFGSFPRSVPCSLVSCENGKPQVQKLPDLPVHAGKGNCDTSLYLAFGDQPGIVCAEVYATYADIEAGRGRYFRLSIGEPQWTEVIAPRRRQAEDVWRWMVPGGLLEGGHAYCVASGRDPGEQRGRTESRKGIGATEDGGDVETDYYSRPLSRILRSPDGESIVRVYDSGILGHRVTLQDLATGKEQVILEQNDTGKYVLFYTGRLLLAPILVPAMLVTGD